MNATATPTESTDTAKLDDSILVDDYSKAGWHYSMTYSASKNSVSITVSGREGQTRFTRVFNPTNAEAKACFAAPFQHLRFEDAKAGNFEKIASEDS